MRSFKGRSPDRKRPVQVYRNLHGGKKNRWSIRQDGLVVAHAADVELERATFVTSESGYQRVVKTGQRNVHAWVSGYLVAKPDYLKWVHYWRRVMYGPRGRFFLKREERWQVVSADRVALHAYGLDCLSPTYGKDWL